MNGHQATDLAVRLCQSFPKGPPAQDWEEHLTPLDEGRANTARVRLVAKGISFGQYIPDFLAMYRQVDTTVTDRHREPCKTCDDSGWKDAPDYENHGCTYTSVQPCNCGEGLQRRNSRIWQERQYA